MIKEQSALISIGHMRLKPQQYQILHTKEIFPGLPDMATIRANFERCIHIIIKLITNLYEPVHAFYNDMLCLHQKSANSFIVAR